MIAHNDVYHSLILSLFLLSLSFVFGGNRGKFAIVKKCTEKKTGAQYAAKILKKRRRGKSVREDILMEIDIMRQGMDHPRIIKLYEVFETQSEFYIIIEL